MIYYDITYITIGALPALPSPQRSPAQTPRLPPVNKCADPKLPEEQ